MCLLEIRGTLTRRWGVRYQSSGLSSSASRTVAGGESPPGRAAFTSILALGGGECEEVELGDGGLFEGLTGEEPDLGGGARSNLLTDAGP